ncbi:MAG: alpha-galactosidase [Anaerolineales bacterium]|nr:alpha-galactosidase [Anaerolineales bacterium]
MSHYLSNPYIALSLHPEKSCWDITPAFSARQSPAPSITNARISLRFHKDLARSAALNQWHTFQVSETQTISSPHGPLQQIDLHIGPDTHLLSYRISFALPVDLPLLLWRIKIKNQGPSPVFLDQIELLNIGFVHLDPTSLNSTPREAYKHTGKRGMIRFPDSHPDRLHKEKDIAFFSNGWQSWSYTGVYSTHEKYRITRLRSIAGPMWYNAGTPQPRRAGTFASDFFGILGDRTTRSAVLLGFLSQKEHFGSLEAYLDPFDPALRLWANGDGVRLDPGAQIASDWACLSYLNLDDTAPITPYLQAVARENNVTADTLSDTIPAGWCSWYHFFQQVGAEDITHNLEAAQSFGESLPLSLIQIDDGFQSQVGDWFKFSPRFPNGVAPLAAEIRQAGFTPGLWLAPFIVHRKSHLYRTHPEWLLRNRLGRPVNAGFIWDTFTTALDLTRPEALDYAAQAVQTAAQSWGFKFLKLDFLYAAALKGRYHDLTRTRAQVMRLGLEALRQAAGPETFLLGCGCPIGSAIGLVQAMRIGADVAPNWHPQWHGITFPFKSETGMPSVRFAIQNALTRLPMNGQWWVNDPDCLLLRPETNLTIDEVYSLATVIALSGGSLLLSDHLPSLPKERLEIAQAMLPLIGKAARAPDWFDSPTPTYLLLPLEGAAGHWSLLAVFNWDDRPRDRALPLEQLFLPAAFGYIAREFWSGCLEYIQHSPFTLKDIPPHGVRLFALRQYNPSTAQYLGSSLHISQGLEVQDWLLDSKQLRFSLTRPGATQGQVILSLPHPPTSVLLDHLPIDWRPAGIKTIYQIPLSFSRCAQMEITW